MRGELDLDYCSFHQNSSLCAFSVTPSPSPSFFLSTSPFVKKYPQKVHFSSLSTSWRGERLWRSFPEKIIKFYTGVDRPVETMGDLFYNGGLKVEGTLRRHIFDEREEIRSFTLVERFMHCSLVYKIDVNCHKIRLYIFWKSMKFENQDLYIKICFSKYRSKQKLGLWY